MEDINSKMQNIKFQLNNIDMQFDNINMQIIQNQNMGIMLNIGDQIQNIGMQMLNLGIQMFDISNIMPNNGMNIINIKNTMENINIQIQNIIDQLNMKIRNIEMPTFNFGINNNNNMMFPIGNINMNNNMMMKNETKKKNVIFSSITGLKFNLVVDYGTTINEVLELYLKKIGKPELIGNNDKILFFFQTERVNFNDNTKIEDYRDNFINKPTPIITVHFL